MKTKGQKRTVSERYLWLGKMLQVIEDVWIFALKTGERKPLSISTEIIPGIKILNLSVITLMHVILYNLYQVCFFRFIRQFFKKANFSFHFCLIKGNKNTLRVGYGIKLSSSKQCYSYFFWAFPNNSRC